MGYLPVKFVNFLKSRLIFILSYYFSMLVNKLFTYLTCVCLKTYKVFLMWISSTYFHVKTKILADFQICISVPLIHNHFSFLLWLLFYYYCIIIIIITIVIPLLVVAMIVVAVAVLAVILSSSLFLSVIVALIIY